jgi:hypothetical protein
MLVPAKTPVLALNVAYRKFVKFWMAELPVLDPWSRSCARHRIINLVMKGS